jgi:hypothetical protein
VANRFVIQLPLLVLILTVSLAASRLLVHYEIDRKLADYLQTTLSNTVLPDSVKKIVPYTSAAQFSQLVNQHRLDYGLSALNSDGSICARGDDPQATTSAVKDIFYACEFCTHASLLKISAFVRPEDMVNYLLANDSSLDMMNNPNLTHMCVSESNNMITAYFVSLNPQQAAAAPAKPVIYQKPVAAAPPKNFSEAELWQALVNYRKAHQRSDLIFDDNICQYARKRVRDHIDRFNQDKPEDYPVPSKYPLDAHAGFGADAESGYAFQVAGKNRLAENLAYWPSATYPHQVIEWGWDTSTEGHREAQLSNEYSHACISGQDGFFVAIFGG